MKNIDQAIQFLKNHPGEKFIPEQIHNNAVTAGKFSALERSLRRRVLKDDLPLEPRIIGLRKEYQRSSNGQKVAYYYWGA